MCKWMRESRYISLWVALHIISLKHLKKKKKVLKVFEMELQSVGDWLRSLQSLNNIFRLVPDLILFLRPLPVPPTLFQAINFCPLPNYVCHRAWVQHPSIIDLDPVTHFPIRLFFCICELKVKLLVYNRQINVLNY